MLFTLSNQITIFTRGSPPLLYLDKSIIKSVYLPYTGILHPFAWGFLALRSFVSLWGIPATCCGIRSDTGRTVTRSTVTACGLLPTFKGEPYPNGRQRKMLQKCGICQKSVWNFEKNENGIVNFVVQCA